MDRTNTNRPVDFAYPPINEVAFSLQFDGDVIDEVGILSKFRPAIDEKYPRVEKYPPIPPAGERFDVPPQQMAPQVQFLQGPPSTRYWFLSADGTRLVQVQGDRLMFNWRQVIGTEPYPHFDTLYPEFSRLAALFVSVVAEQHGQPPSAAWCELTYINPIDAEGEAAGTHGQLAHILNYLVRDPARETLPPVEDTQIQQRFRITDDDGVPVGRLYVSAVPGFRQVDSKPVYVLTLLARSRAAIGEVSSQLDPFFLKAHDLIVRGFKEVTTVEMHRRWGVEK